MKNSFLSKSIKTVMLLALSMQIVAQDSALQELPKDSDEQKTGKSFIRRIFTADYKTKQEERVAKEINYWIKKGIILVVVVILLLVIRQQTLHDLQLLRSEVRKEVRFERDSIRTDIIPDLRLVKAEIVQIMEQQTDQTSNNLKDRIDQASIRLEQRIDQIDQRLKGRLEQMSNMKDDTANLLARMRVLGYFPIDFPTVEQIHREQEQEDCRATEQQEQASGWGIWDFFNGSPDRSSGQTFTTDTN